MVCIYCKNEINSKNKSNEHVFPSAFGCPDDWIIDCVCRGCNNAFGGTMERYLAGDSIEGLWRLQKIGSRSQRPIRQARIKIHIPDENIYGEFKGVILYADFAQMDSLYLPPQILTWGNAGERKFTLLECMSDNDIKNVPGKFELFTHNEKEYNEAVARLEKLGKKLEEGIHRLPKTAIGIDGKLEVQTESVIDAVIFRTIAKIAFNYLAKIQGAEYILGQKFDNIRSYIRSECKSDFHPVTIEKGHILVEETDDKYFLEGHIFTIETRGNLIISKISLTNMFNFYYVVTLGEMSPIWHDIKAGHAYSLKEDKIIPLFTPTYLSITSRLRKIFGHPLRI
ncbi:MAG: hypothetical protein HY210_09295 [Candidatus Omnitrophica bacterium]|nr:hypothetical protein [Candidatus Omnitrophota bacterium]